MLTFDCAPADEPKENPVNGLAGLAAVVLDVAPLTDGEPVGVPGDPNEKPAKGLAA